ncbi:hypothetical protein BJ508DRAFT_332636 [Ascobolus immersus RN42]|uniref:Uncharacterized protein n=1 Tax=Ascobolus immersus RN42 TaxID=1160509 RepID=A0A3N4HZ13_ASCIM|nr:hypothetical protein BJ508DRAFT_332636 [Ascobolus immersus RN42]
MSVMKVDNDSAVKELKREIRTVFRYKYQYIFRKSWKNMSETVKEDLMYTFAVEFHSWNWEQWRIKKTVMTLGEDGQRNHRVKQKQKEKARAELLRSLRSAGVIKTNVGADVPEEIEMLVTGTSRPPDHPGRDDRPHARHRHGSSTGRESKDDTRSSSRRYPARSRDVFHTEHRRDHVDREGRVEKSRHEQRSHHGQHTHANHHREQRSKVSKSPTMYETSSRSTRGLDREEHNDIRSRRMREESVALDSRRGLVQARLPLLPVDYDGRSMRSDGHIRGDPSARYGHEHIRDGTPHGRDYVSDRDPGYTRGQKESHRAYPANSSSSHSLHLYEANSRIGGHDSHRSMGNGSGVPLYQSDSSVDASLTRRPRSRSRHTHDNMDSDDYLYSLKASPIRPESLPPSSTDHFQRQQTHLSDIDMRSSPVATYNHGKGLPQSSTEARKRRRTISPVSSYASMGHDYYSSPQGPTYSNHGSVTPPQLDDEPLQYARQGHEYFRSSPRSDRSLTTSARLVSMSPTSRDRVPIDPLQMTTTTEEAARTAEAALQ